jgi:two-component system chemotaxis sensor kinase CheA
VDKNIISLIDDPLTHIIRNSMDHGIETIEERRAAGKSEKAHLLLEAKGSGGDVHIIIQDDGRGINTERVLQKAIEKGLTTKPANEYTDREIHQFIFNPGFSTKDEEEVSDLSGRGVGMDLVSKNLAKLSGTVSVHSVRGQGTTVTLKVPLTLSIIKGMSVMVAGARYTIPINFIIKSFQPLEENLFMDPNGNEMVKERDEIYNIVRFHEFFDIEGAKTDVVKGTLMLLESGDDKICLLVDELKSQHDAVVKPLPKYFKKVDGLSGCTLLGNGEISLIVDPQAMFDK